jgi:hypothetical protein
MYCSLLLSEIHCHLFKMYHGLIDNSAFIRKSQWSRGYCVKISVKLSLVNVMCLLQRGKEHYKHKFVCDYSRKSKEHSEQVTSGGNVSDLCQVCYFESCLGRRKSCTNNVGTWRQIARRCFELGPHCSLSSTDSVPQACSYDIVFK